LLVKIPDFELTALSQTPAAGKGKGREGKNRNRGEGRCGDGGKGDKEGERERGDEEEGRRRGRKKGEGRKEWGLQDATYVKPIHFSVVRYLIPSQPRAPTIKVKGQDIYIPPFTGKQEQQRFTLRSTCMRW